MAVSTLRGAPTMAPPDWPDTMRDMRYTPGNVPVSLGETVHYRSHGSAPGLNGVQVHRSRCRAAIVTDLLAGNMVTLFVINPSGVFFDDCPYDDAMTGGSWHLPDAGAKDCD